ALGMDGLDHATARAAMLGALHFSAFPDAPGALRELRDRGLRLVVVSNWDCSLPGVLEQAGLADLLDGGLTYATVRASTPGGRGRARPGRAHRDAERGGPRGPDPRGHGGGPRGPDAQAPAVSLRPAARAVLADGGLGRARPAHLLRVRSGLRRGRAPARPAA